MGLTVVVIGGGIGGLSLARELAIRGRSAVVLERAPTLAPVGAGIIMNPNAMRVLERNQLAGALRPHGWPYRARETRDHRGALLAVRDYRPLVEAGRIPLGVLVHRAHLCRVLHEELPPGAVRVGVRICRLAATVDGIRVESESGETLEGDLLVGADGIRSEVRARLFEGVEPVYLGYRSHRFVVANADGVEHFTEFLGRGRRVGLVPISRDELYVWTTFNSPRGSRAWGLESLAALRELFREFTDPRVRGAFARIESIESVLCTDIEEVHQPAWVRGRAVLLGDAAHALSPNMGQGAGMAMEDAAVLAQELDAAHDGASGLAAALRAYEARRWSRVETVMRLSRTVGEEGQVAGRLACWLRNRRVRREGQDVPRMQEALDRLLAYPI